MLFIILFLHQTTTCVPWCRSSPCCLSSCSYIKPQRHGKSPRCLLVVYHLVPTSNHNSVSLLYISSVVVYHLVPTSNHNPQTIPRYVFEVVYHLVPTSNHNIGAGVRGLAKVVYHLVPTSNHNVRTNCLVYEALFIILFLHQTTTCFTRQPHTATLFIILFLHQTTTSVT